MLLLATQEGRTASTQDLHQSSLVTESHTPTYVTPSQRSQWLLLCVEMMAVDAVAVVVVVVFSVVPETTLGVPSASKDIFCLIQEDTELDPRP